MTNSNPLDPKEILNFLTKGQGLPRWQELQRHRSWWKVGGEYITAEATNFSIGGSKFSGQACDGFGEGTDRVLIRCSCGR